jgi:hypothetical protein
VGEVRERGRRQRLERMLSVTAAGSPPIRGMWTKQRPRRLACLRGRHQKRVMSPALLSSARATSTSVSRGVGGACLAADREQLWN